MQPKGVIPYVFGSGVAPVPATAMPSSTDGQSATQAGLQGVVARVYGYNGNNQWDRLLALPLNAGNISSSAGNLGGLVSINLNYLWDGDELFSPQQSVSGFLQSQSVKPKGIAAVAQVGGWTAYDVPATNVAAVATKAATGANTTHIVTSICVSVIGLAAAAETTVTAQLLDNSATVFWSMRFQVIPGGTTGIGLTNLVIPFGGNSSAILQFTAAGGANTFQSVSMTGYTV